MSKAALSRGIYRREAVPTRTVGPNQRFLGQLEQHEGPWNEQTWVIVEVAGDPPRGQVATCEVRRCDGAQYQKHAQCYGHHWRWLRAGSPDLAEWLLREHKPVRGTPDTRSRRAFDFATVPVLVAEELRFVVGAKITRGEWTSNPRLRVMVELLALLAADQRVETLTEHTHEEWIEFARHHPEVRLSVFNRETRIYFNSFFTVLNRALVVDPWEQEDWLWKGMFDGILGQKDRQCRGNLNWSAVSAPWLREPLMLYARECLQGGSRSWSTMAKWMTGFRRLSDYLAVVGVNNADELDRRTFLRWLEWERANGGAEDDIRRHANTVASLLTTMKLDGFLPELPGVVYLRDGEATIKPKIAPRPFPKDVLERIDSLIVDNTAVDPQIRIILKYNRWAGSRASELVELPIDCLRDNGKGGFWVEYYASKQDANRRFPLPEELGLAMVAQRKLVVEMYGETARHMFPQSKTSNASTGTTRPWSQAGLYKALRRTFAAVGIAQSSITGESISGSEIHRFRHSIGTDLLNNGWTQKEVQDFLGHQSPTMTARYAEINDDTLNKKADAFHEQQVADRKAMNASTSIDNGVERLRGKITAVLAHGNCTLPGHLYCSVRDEDPCTGCAFFDKGQGEFAATHSTYRTQLKFTIKSASESDEPGAAKIVDINQKRLDKLDAVAPEKGDQK